MDNLRPISISSVLLRLLNNILGSRCSNISINVNQRVFTKNDETLINNLALHSTIKKRRTNLKPYNIVSIDQEKSFNTVSHFSIYRALERLNVADTTIKYI